MNKTGFRVKKTPKGQLHLGWCNLCQCVFVYCPHCGNNSCNAAFGKKIPDGTPATSKEEQCPLCEKSYQLMIEIGKNPKIETLIEELVDSKLLTEKFESELERDKIRRSQKS